MSVVKTLVSNVVDAVAGTESAGSGLEDFLSKFNSPQKYVETIDPLGTFDVVMRFFPARAYNKSSKGDSDVISKIGSAVGAAADKALNNALDNVTGGLYSSIKNTSAKTVEQQRMEFGGVGKYSFLEYLVKSNLVQDDVTHPIDLNIGLYVQSISVPNIDVLNSSDQQTNIGRFPVAGSWVSANGVLNLSIINTKAALHERLFYPWLRETTLPYWSYDTQPFTTATITIDYTKHNDVKYVFCGCRPTEIKTLQATQAADSANLTRDVVMAYDFMYVTTDFKTMDSAKSKILDALGSVGSGAAKMFNIN